MGDRWGTRISPKQFDNLRQRLWDLPERMRTAGLNSVAAFIRRLIHPQLGFQVHPSLGFLREAALINELPMEYALRRMFEEKTGLSPFQFIDFAFATYTAVIVDNKKVISFRWYDPLRRTYGDRAFQSFLSIVSRTYEELPLFARSLMRSTHRHESEYFEFTPFRRFPFIRDEMGLRVWHPMVFYRGMEGIVHSVLSDSGALYTTPFSKLFERHVLSQMNDVQALQLGEEELREILGYQSKVTDGLLSFGEANVYIEAKVGIFKDLIMTVGDPDYFRTITRSLARAIEQGWTVSSGMRQSEAAPERVRMAATDYLLVVTNWEFAVGDGKKLHEMYPEGKLEYPSKDIERFMPLTHVFFISIDDYERLLEAVKRDSLSLPDFLNSCVIRNSDPVTAKHLFDQHLTENRVQFGRSRLLQDALSESEARLTAMLESG